MSFDDAGGYLSRMVRQCAWCLQVADAAGRYRFQPGAKLYDASHGICPTCAEHELAMIKALAARDGRVLGSRIKG